MTTDQPSVRPRWQRWLADRESFLLPSGSLFGLLLVWELAARLGLIETFFFSSPTLVLAAGAHHIQTPQFWRDVQVSSEEFFVGYMAAAALAIPFGLLTGWFRPLHYMFEPWLAAFNAMPRLALLPLVILWVGLGFWSKAVIVFLGVFFPVAINTFNGVRTVDPNLDEVSRTFGASTYRRIVSVVVPSVIPFTLVGLRLGIGRAVSGIVIAEFITAQEGLGKFIFRQSAQLDTAGMLFGTFFLTALAVLGFFALGVFERRVKRWQPRVGSA